MSEEQFEEWCPVCRKPFKKCTCTEAERDNREHEEDSYGDY